MPSLNILNYKIMAKSQIKVSVRNISNDHVHFERILTVDDSVMFPYSQIVDALGVLYDGMSVKVVVEKAAYNS